MTERPVSPAPRGETQWRSWLIERIAAVSNRRVTDRDADRPLLALGVSSRDAVTLAAQAGEVLGREVPSTVAWTAPTIAELARLFAAGPEAVTGGEPGRAHDENGANGGDVAVVGLACRFPGAATPGEFWNLLTAGRAAIGEVPAGRWERFVPDVAGHDVPRHGGFLGDACAFDAEFFGISPGEAAVMDPQQRLLLEVAWEALAHAGIPPASLRGTDCGVFVGLSAVEYAQLTMTDLNRVEAWSSTGAAASVTANRVSYALGVHGPSITVDTACSSSLVAVHQAARALVEGDASAAVVGGVNLLLSPAITASFHRAGLLAADGRCKPFDASADGIVRGEGCGVLVLKRLGDARRDGDRILAVLKGSAVNSDGRSNGLMAPNPVAQQRVLARAYARAGVRARAIDYVEAHGTGTLVGDPIEAGALAAVLGEGRTERRPLLIGSVKSNLGHLEGAAGIAGVIKVVLGLWHSRIPSSLHFTTPNPHIDFAAGRLAVVTEDTEWPRYPGIARAGVSSFGFGGTNAHVVLEEWTGERGARRAGRDVRPARPEIVTLAERSTPRLRARARAMAEWLDHQGGDTETATVAAALAHARDDAPARAAILARERGQLRDRLRLLAEGRPDKSVLTGSPVGDPVFVFSGYGSQWPGMGRGLLAEEPAFADAVTALDGVFHDVVGVALSDLLAEGHGGAAAPRLSGQQLTLFGMQVALARLWQAHGVRPAAVLGHSMGEVAAAVTAGALTPGDGLRVMVHRTALLDELQEQGTGAMAAVELPPQRLATLGDRFDRVSVAVYTSPTQCTVSGPAEQVTALVARVEAEGGLAKILPTGVAGHSAAVDPLLDRLTSALAELRVGESTVACYTSVLDDPRQRPGYDAGYWAANLRRPVRFSQAVAAAIADGHRLFVEVSPHPIAGIAATGDVTVVPTLRRDPGGTVDGFATALAAMCVHGKADPHADPPRLRYPDRVVIDLPPPVWEHRTYWADGPESTLPPERLAYQAEWVPRELPAAVDANANGQLAHANGQLAHANGQLAHANGQLAHGNGQLAEWLVVHADGVDPAPLVHCLAEHGHRATAVPLAEHDRLAAIGTGPALAGVVVLPAGVDSPAEIDAARAGTLAVAAVVRELAGLDATPPRLWLVTRGAAAVRPGDAGRPGPAALRGLVRVLAYEHPELRATMLDLDDRHDKPPWGTAVRELLADPPEDELAWRDDRRLAYTLARADLTTRQEAPVVRDGAYVITGGLGGLGIAAARWLAGAGATRLVLSARREPAAGARAAIEEISAAGVQVEVVTGDIAEPGVAERLVGAATEGAMPLRGVLHAAGVLADGAVLTMDAEALAATWRAKTEGALRLHEACAGVELDWWLAYSSAAALFGSPGQAAYATANAWLDAFVAWRRGHGLPAATIQWGAWAEIGAATGKDNPVLDPMPPGEAIRALPAVLASGRTQTAITRLHSEAVLELFPRLARRPFFAALVRSADQRADAAPTARGVLALATEDPDRAHAAVRDHVVSTLAELMWLDGERLDPDAPLTSLGLDSLLAMRARAAVERDFGVTVPLPLLLRGATIAGLADHLVERLRTRRTIEAVPELPERVGGPEPRDFAERWVGRMLRRTLGADVGLGVHAPLTEAGLDDVAARKLLTAISAEPGTTITARELFAVPTVAGLADLVRADLEGADTGPVRPLGGAGNGRPLYLFHAAGSPTAVYRPLSELLDAEVACYGMERLDHLDTVEAKAAHYAELIRGQQPDGAYRLGGWSFGGMLAFETARQLVATGAEIELLFLIDTIIPLPDPDSTPQDALCARLRRFVEYVEQTYQVDLELPAADLVALPEAERDELVMRRLSERVAGMGTAVLDHQRTSYVDAQISERYTPAEYAGPVLLFRAKDPHPLTSALDPRYLRTDDALGWDQYCANLDVVKVPGDHITIIDPPHITVVADRIRDTLATKDGSRK